jgi:serine/threonine protein kinase
MALDTLTQEPVAIKKNKRIFPLMSEQKPKENELPQDPRQLLRTILVPKRILRELKILIHLNHPNIVNMKEVFLPVSYAAFRE